MSISESSADDPVVVSGIGVTLPGTDTVAQLWANVEGGRSQIGKQTRFDPYSQDVPVYSAAQIEDFDYRAHLPELAPSHAAKYSREGLITMASVAKAREDAGLAGAAVDPSRTSIIMSSSRGPLGWWRTAMSGEDPDAFADKGAMFRGLPGCSASLSAIYVGARGLVTTLSNACVGGHQALGLGVREIEAGASDVVYVGGHEFPILAEVARCYLALGSGVLSPERDDPSHAVRPYNADREGFALGEGAVVLTLERQSHALRRGANPYATVLGHRSFNEADHPTTMDMTGELTAGVVREALAPSGRTPEDVDYFCAHGTATKYNDIAESRALRALYPQRGDDALPPLSSNKPIYGHTFGIAGIINVAATSLMLRNQRLAPTINIDDVDPECDHDHVAGTSRAADVETAVSLSFAFGSQTAVVALGRAS